LWNDFCAFAGDFTWLLMKLILLFLTLALPYLSAMSQTVIVIGAEDGKPVTDVAVYNEARNQFCYTNYAGKASTSLSKELHLLLTNLKRQDGLLSSGPRLLKLKSSSYLLTGGNKNLTKYLII
jgi:hypothetical protein